MLRSPKPARHWIPPCSPFVYHCERVIWQHAVLHQAHIDEFYRFSEGRLSACFTPSPGDAPSLLWALTQITRSILIGNPHCFWLYNIYYTTPGACCASLDATRLLFYLLLTKKVLQQQQQLRQLRGEVAKAHGGAASSHEGAQADRRGVSFPGFFRWWRHDRSHQTADGRKEGAAGVPTGRVTVV